MNPIQNKLEQVFKEYIEFKNIAQEDSKNLENLKKEAAQESLNLETVEEQAGLFFDKIGEKEIFKIDFLESQKRLYYYVQAYKELLEIPIEILNEVEDYKVKTVFAVINGKREIVDKELYNSYKKQNQEYTKIQIDIFNKNFKN